MMTIKVIFKHKCQGVGCKTPNINVDFDVEVKNGAYVLPTVRCIYTEQELIRVV